MGLAEVAIGDMSKCPNASLETQETAPVRHLSAVA
jgi:hypothetical protein